MTVMKRLRIVDFTADHVAEATALALANFEEERKCVSALPPISALPTLNTFADNDFGSAAIDSENGRLLGFLCFHKPWDNAFTSTAIGTFSPLHGHGSVLQHRDIIYQQLYQAVSKKLIAVGATSHAIALYAHDTVTEQAFFHYGFGMRCIDAIRRNEPTLVPGPQFPIRVLKHNEAELIRDLRRRLSMHLSESPCYMFTPDTAFELWLARAEARDSLLFAAFDGEKTVAFVEVTDEGENFVSEATDIKNICGAYCLPEYRGSGLMQNLVNSAGTYLKQQGIQRLGVDFESINPTASAFWLKNFTAYTHSVVRRIDEGVLMRAASI